MQSLRPAATPKPWPTPSVRLTTCWSSSGHHELASSGAAVQAAVDRLGRIDVLVNNAGNFYAGFFEELAPEQIERSLNTNLVGAMNITRAVLPVLRKQRSRKVVTITSTAGVVGQEFCSAYAAAKFGAEGWMESLRSEVEPFGIHTRSWSRASSAPSC